MLKDLKEHPCLAFDYGRAQNIWKFMKPQTPVEMEEVKIDPIFTTNFSESLMEEVVSRVGLALLPDWLVDYHPKKSKIQKVLTEYNANPQSMNTAIHILYPENRRQMKRVRVFVDFLKAYYEQSKSKSV